MFRIAIEAEILFAARVMQVRFLKRPSGKTPLKKNSSGKKIEAESAVPILVHLYIVIMIHKYRQSAKENCLLKRNTAPEVFPLTIGSGKTKPFEKRRSRYKETAENKAEAYRVYVEHLFSACDAVDARIFSKGDGETIIYTYDKGGQLKGVSGVKNTVKGTETYSYIDTIVYDEHGQRVYIKYGNGVETRYRYDDKRRWLKDIETKNKQTDETFQKISYRFDKVGNVLGYSNDASVYETSQNYTYGSLYQLIGVEGTSNQYKAIKSFGSTPVHVAKYKQDFAFDGIGNMTKKASTTNLPGARGNAYPKAELDYSLDYEYDPAYAHRLVHAGNRYYRYDANGNITAEKDGPFTEDEEFVFTYSYDPDTDVYGTDYGFGLDAPKETEETHPENLFAYRRNYTWNEKNLLTKSSDRTYTVHYRYGEDGQRALKYTGEGRSETLYFNNFYTIHIPVQDKNNPQGLRVHKHIFVGNSRLVTAMTHTDNNGDNAEQREKRYYYHSDHLGSAQFVTDWRGRQYEHIDYTPYGELWIEEVAAGLDKLPFRFTGKEMDEETGLYYYGARYLDPKYSRWLSGDPALSYYVDGKSNGSSGGIYNPINFNLYHYADNNPIRYIDPTGLEEDVSEAERQLKELRQLGEEMFYKGTINGINLYTENYEDGCYARATVIAGELEKLGFGVTDYSYVTSPVMPGVIKAEKAAKRDPSKVPDKDSEGNSNRYRFHVAATVIIDGKKYVVDPYYHKSWLSISEQEDWYSCQYPRGTSTQPAHDKSGNLIGPPAMTSWKTRSSYTGTLSINEYAQGWLKNYDSVKRDNEKNKKNNNPYIWSGK